MSAVFCLIMAHGFIMECFKDDSYSAFVKTLRFVQRDHYGTWPPHLEQTPPESKMAVQLVR